ncbi:MAG: AbrB/MazE/SpoVT family DNA-binding domain-containing protein [Nitrospinota bacterium]
MELVRVEADGRVVLPKEVRESLHIGRGDLLGLEIKDDEIIMMPIAKIPKSQAWFWSEKWQKKEKEINRAKEESKIKGPLTLEEALRDLKLEKI